MLPPSVRAPTDLGTPKPLRLSDCSEWDDNAEADAAIRDPLRGGKRMRKGELSEKTADGAHR